MKKMALVFFLFAAACQPRIDIDLKQFGDRAYMSRVLVFRLDGTEEQLAEYKRTGQLTPAIKQVFIDQGTTIDSAGAKAVSKLPAGTNLKNVGIAFNHSAQKIEPLNGAPAAGHLADFSAGPYKYRLFSADGTTRDWTVSFTIAP